MLDELTVRAVQANIATLDALVVSSSCQGVLALRSSVNHQGLSRVLGLMCYEQSSYTETVRLVPTPKQISVKETETLI